METKDYIALEQQYGAHNYHPLDVVIQRARADNIIMKIISIAPARLKSNEKPMKPYLLLTDGTDYI